MLRTVLTTDAQSFVPPGGALPNLSVKLAVSDGQAGAVIGKGGDTVRQIRADTGTLVKILPQREMPPGVRVTLASCRNSDCA